VTAATQSATPSVSTVTGSTAPTARLVEKLSGAIAARFGRRGFFARSAVVGTALAANPVTFALKPTSAYAAICSCNGSSCECGSTCCDGYTEFCCTITGQNKCPAGTIMGGWWKADDTGFCSGARYYMDCNATCGGCGCGGSGVCAGSCSGTPCGCAFGDCNNRKAGCTMFRYGQCNQHIACIGPIICRVITCIPPWQLEPSCTTTLRVDQATAFHDRPCAHAVVGSFDSAVESGNGIRIRGWSLDFDTDQPTPIHVYVDGGLAAVATANAYRPDVGAAYRGWGDNHGFDVTVPIAPGASRQICVYGLNVGAGSVNQLLGCKTARLTAPFGSFDGVSAGSGNVRLTGWAIDPDTTLPIKVHAYVDGAYKGEFTANASRPDVGSAYPGFGNNHGFDFTIPISGGQHQICVFAINAGAGTVNPMIGCRTIDVGTPFGNVESIVSAGGGLRVRGWAIDPDTTGPVKVHAYVDGSFKGEFTADQARADVGAFFPQFGPNHGFDFFIPASPGAHSVCLYAINTPGGVNPLLACRSATVQSGDPFGFLDRAIGGPGLVRLQGWVIDPDATGATKVFVYVDGTFRGEFAADQNRPDIGAAYPGYGSAHGFEFDLPVAAGFREICVWSANVGAGSNKLLACRGVQIGGNPFGALDVVRGQSGSVHLQGWLIDPDTSGPAKVHVYIDDVFRGEFTADQSRPDVATVYPLYGSNHGFSMTIPATAGSRRVCVFGINSGSGNDNPVLGCRTASVS
jgi:hypothetical protein